MMMILNHIMQYHRRFCRLNEHGLSIDNVTAYSADNFNYSKNNSVNEKLFCKNRDIIKML